jgi:hypothetical protein
MQPTDPVTYFLANPIDESLVLIFAPTLPDSIVLVIDAAVRMPKSEREHSPGGIREARKIQFEKASDYLRQNSSTALASFETYRIKPKSVGVAIYGVNVRRSRGKYRFSATLGNFGDVEFLFEEIRCEHRVIKAKEQNLAGEWNYADARTGEAVNFYDPFATTA